MVIATNPLIDLRDADRADYTVGDYYTDMWVLHDVRHDSAVCTTNQLYAEKLARRIAADCANRYGRTALAEYLITHPKGEPVTAETKILDDIEDSDYSDFDLGAFYTATGYCLDMWAIPGGRESTALSVRAGRIHDDLCRVCATMYGNTALADYFSAH
jgi:hypothetical protein